MSHRVEKITDWESLFGLFDFDNYAQQKLGINEKRPWIFRGQASPWPLTTSLERAIKSFNISLERAHKSQDGTIGIEKRLVREFQRQQHLYTDGQHMPEDKNNTPEWLALMQHHGAPSRLLDCTYSFPVAAFFAFSATSPATEATVWAINPSWLEKIARQICKANGAEDDLILWEKKRNTATAVAAAAWRKVYMRGFPGNSDDPNDPDTTGDPIAFIKDFNPLKLNQRQSRQQGVFLLTADVSKSFDDNLKAMKKIEAPGDNIICFTIEDRQKHREKVLKFLHRMNINNAHLFPGLDGFAQSLWTSTPILNEAILVP